MHAVTFQAPGEVAVEERPDPEPQAPDDVVVRIEASGICGSDLHIYHGRVPVERGFTIGHEFVGTVVAAGDAVTRAQVGDRVLGCFHVACATCAPCLRGDYHRCAEGRTFGHGVALGDLQGAQAEQVLVPRANVTLRRVPDRMPSEVALFAGDVMGTGYHAAVVQGGVTPGATVAVIGLGPVGLCAVQAARAAGAAQVYAIDTVADRLALAERFGAAPLHLTDDDPKRTIRAATGGGVDVTIDAVGDPAPLALAVSLTRDAGTVAGIGAYAGKAEVPLGLAWLKGLKLHLGLANVIAHVDRVLALLQAGVLDPSPIVSHRMPLAEAPTAYRLYDAREALKVVLMP